ncbi:MAG: tRNA (adenosine(37)-N6)-threonylcarbamoyltransferase complex ATPase subunit type 1 TsaE [Coriobacteriia bacterium]|nr:tRNA (adenosine(37)-N6)-threonylcarbamoyltransferase complex ATPase subunit type 1 TsaE [Coriobacteriia bacterium]MBN2823255.1 tRNA (adenosine(37)-N6)-threonylcarbamoyltransferase complex ATPase subunit type 1 TsaE [Coriobacteriia bacterium]
MTLTLHTSSEHATERLGTRLAALLRVGDVVALSGDLGAGKTHFVKGVAAGLGVPEPVTSPTFNILLVHMGRLPLYHFDLYRLEHAEQLEDIDFWGTLESDGVSFIEWGDRFPEALPQDRMEIVIHREDVDTRRLEINPSGPRSSQLAVDWVAACGGPEVSA